MEECRIHHEQWSQIMGLLDCIKNEQERIDEEQQDKLDLIISQQADILKALTASNRKAQFRFKGVMTMPLTLGAGQSDKFYLTLQAPSPDGGTTPGAYLTALDPGETVALSSDDPATVTLALDAVTVQDPDPQPDGMPAPPSVASGTVAGASAPAQPGVPVKVTATFNLSSGKADASVSDTVAVSAGARKAGILFGTEAPILSTKANKKPT